MDVRLLQSQVVPAQADAMKLSSRYIFKYKRNSFFRISAVKNDVTANRSDAATASDS